MKAVLDPHHDKIWALTRIVTGVFVAMHGLQKFGLLGGEAKPMFSQLWIGGCIELVAGSLIAVGFFTSWAAFLLSGMFAVAYFQFHHPHGLLPLQNKGELAAVYSFLFLLIASRGAGIWSVDANRS